MEYKNYLMCHFSGEKKDGEQVYFSLSKDGFHWKDLNQGKPVLFSNIGELGLRDPFLIRDEKNQKFYIIATDLRIEAGKGWDIAQFEGSKSILQFESTDLIHWTKARAVSVMRDEVGCVWAPEAIYDEEKEAFFVYWASMDLKGNREGKQCIYCAYTKDFLTYEKIQKYIEKENHVIDTTMIRVGDTYYRFSKDETRKTILLEKGKKLLGEFEAVPSKVLDSIYEVEGPFVFGLLDKKEWVLMVDRFTSCEGFPSGKGYLPLVSKDLNTGDFEIKNDAEFDMGGTLKRHGSLIAITDKEYETLVQHF